MPDDLDAFLKKAAQKRKKRKQPGIVILDGSQAPPPEPPPRTLVRPEPPTPEERAPLSDPVAQHVAKHLDESQFEVRAEKMADDIEQSDDRMEAHLHAVFDHEVGSMQHFDHDAPPPITASAEMTGRIVDMFRSPENLRTAVLLHEILTPRSLKLD